MNKLERKLYNLITEEGDIVKNKKTGNVYMVKQFDPNKHDKPSPAEIEKAKASNGGEVPKGETPKGKKPQGKPSDKQEPKGKTATQPTTGGGGGGSSALNAPPQQKIDKLNPAVAKQKAAINKASSQDTNQPVPQKIAAADFKSDAEKDKEKPEPTSNPNKSTKRVGADDTKLKNLMPGIDTSVPTLDQNPMAREKLSMKMGELADRVKNASSKEEADSIDACQVTIPGTNLYCDDNLNIPRTEMPQFKGNARPGSDADKLPKNKDGEVDGEAFFKKFLKDNNISVNNGKDDKGVEVPPDRMKATQRDMQASKILGMADGLEKDPENPNLTAPIMVSSDGYVLDGHHRWAAMILHNSKHPDKPIPLKATIIDKPIKDLVPVANKFGDEMGIMKKSVGKPKAPIAENKIIKLSSLLK